MKNFRSLVNTLFKSLSSVFFDISSGSLDDNNGIGSIGVGCGANNDDIGGVDGCGGGNKDGDSGGGIGDDEDGGGDDNDNGGSGISGGGYNSAVAMMIIMIVMVVVVAEMTIIKYEEFVFF